LHEPGLKTDKGVNGSSFQQSYDPKNALENAREILTDTPKRIYPPLFNTLSAEIKMVLLYGGFYREA
jgi:hypothetical protein